jgi:hypothetical protein
MRELRKLCEGSLGGYDFVVLILHGKTLRADEMVIALGITEESRKIPIGFVQTGRGHSWDSNQS